jgi:hypothetical protein
MGIANEAAYRCKRMLHFATRAIPESSCRENLVIATIWQMLFLSGTATILTGVNPSLRRY